MGLDLTERSMRAIEELTAALGENTEDLHNGLAFSVQSPAFDRLAAARDLAYVLCQVMAGTHRVGDGLRELADRMDRLETAGATACAAEQEAIG